MPHERPSTPPSIRPGDHQLFDQHPSVMLLIDPADGSIVAANAAAERFYGWGRDELASMRIDQINLLDPAQVREEMDAARAQRRTHFEFRHRLASGEIRDVDVHSGPVELDGRTVLFSVINDATDRRRLREALRESESFARAVAANAPLGIVVTDLEGRLLRVNPALCDMTGFTEHELLGRGVMELTHPDDRRHLRRTSDELLTGSGAVRGHSLQLRCKDGSAVPVRAAASLLRDHTGSAIAKVGMLADLTEEQRASSRLEALVAHAPDMIAVVDRDGRATYLSPAASELIADTDTEVSGASLIELVHEDDLDAARAALRAAHRAPGSMQQLTCRIRGHDGDWRHLDVRLTDLAEVAAVGGLVVNARDVTEHVRAEAHAHHVARHDQLTGLVNRSEFHRRLETLLLSPPTPAPGAPTLVLIDLDRFAATNDLLGNHVGDELLSQASGRLRQLLGDEALVGRTGGDEFAVVLRATDREHARRTADRIARHLGDPYPLSSGGTVRISASVGVAAHEPGMALDDWLHDAEHALAEAKRRGKGTVQSANLRLRARARRRSELEHALHQPDLVGQLAVNYQPIVELATGRPVAVEALLRWRHPTLGPVSPAEFIPIAERTGAIVPIGTWVIEEACRQLARWDHEGLAPDLRVSVNLSARQLADEAVVATIERTLAAAPLAPDRLVIELTETMLADETDPLRRTLAAIGALGVQLHIDDFGTGYSSLLELQRSPATGLKIDRSFVAPLPGDGAARAIVTAILQLARALGLSVIAEGVERADQRDELLRLGCTTAQGFLWAAPAPADRVTAAFLDEGG